MGKPNISYSNAGSKVLQPFTIETLGTIGTTSHGISLKSSNYGISLQSRQSQANKIKAESVTKTTLTAKSVSSQRFESRMENFGSEIHVLKDDSLENAFTTILSKLYINGWRLVSDGMSLITRMPKEVIESSRCIKRMLETSTNANEMIDEGPHATNKEIRVAITQMSNVQGVRLRMSKSISRSVSSKLLCESVCESQKHSHKSLDCCSASQKNTTTSLPDFTSPQSSVRRTSTETSRVQIIPEMVYKSCSCRQPTPIQRQTLVTTSPKPSSWKNIPNRWSLANTGWIPVLAIFLLVPSTTTVAQQVLHHPKPVRSNTTTHAAGYDSRTSWNSLPLSHSETNIPSSVMDTNTLNKKEEDTFTKRNSPTSEDLTAESNSKSDMTSKIEGRKQTDVFYHDPVAALPEEEIYLPPEIFGTDFWNYSNDTFYEQEDENIKDKDQSNLKYPVSTTEDPFFRFFRTEMIAEHDDTSDQNRTRQEDSDDRSRNATSDLEKLLDYSSDNYINENDINNILYYNSIVDSNDGKPNYEKSGEDATYNRRGVQFQDEIKIHEKSSHKTRKEIKKRKQIFAEQMNSALAKEMDRSQNNPKTEIKDTVYNFGQNSLDLPKNTEPQEFVNDIPSNPAPLDYVSDYLKSVGPNDYVNDDPHVTPSKLEDENYHQSPSAGLWGHEVLSAPQWSHYPKIYRGLKRDKLARKTKNTKQNKGGARILASSHYELQYILGRKIIFLCVARGRPRPRITWYKDGVELYAHNYFQVHEWDIGRFKLKSKMEIDPATPMDAGYYKCEANNEQGVDQAGFRTKYRVQ